MPISEKRLAELAAIADKDIDTSDIAEADEAWFKDAKLIMPSASRTVPDPADEVETAG